MAAAAAACEPTSGKLTIPLPSSELTSKSTGSTSRRPTTSGVALGQRGSARHGVAAVGRALDGTTATVDAQDGDMATAMVRQPRRRAQTRPADPSVAGGSRPDTSVPGIALLAATATDDARCGAATTGDVRDGDAWDGDERSGNARDGDARDGGTLDGNARDGDARDGRRSGRRSVR